MKQGKWDHWSRSWLGPGISKPHWITIKSPLFTIKPPSYWLRGFDFGKHAMVYETKPMESPSVHTKIAGIYRRKNLPQIWRNNEKHRFWMEKCRISILIRSIKTPVDESDGLSVAWIAHGMKIWPWHGDIFWRWCLRHPRPPPMVNRFNWRAAFPFQSPLASSAELYSKNTHMAGAAWNRLSRFHKKNPIRSLMRT